MKTSAVKKNVFSSYSKKPCRDCGEMAVVMNCTPWTRTFHCKECRSTYTVFRHDFDPVNDPGDKFVELYPFMGLICCPGIGRFTGRGYIPVRASA
jgi:hypothetical protein